MTDLNSTIEQLADEQANHVDVLNNYVECCFDSHMGNDDEIARNLREYYRLSDEVDGEALEDLIAYVVTELDIVAELDHSIWTSNGELAAMFYGESEQYIPLEAIAARLDLSVTQVEKLAETDELAIEDGCIIHYYTCNAIKFFPADDEAKHELVKRCRAANIAALRKAA